MKKIKSYSSIWNVEKVIYAINDLQLPFPVTLSQMTWFILSLFIITIFSNVPPLSFIDGALLKYLGIPIAITWFMSRKTFDGKKPVSFLKSVLTYTFRNKISCAFKPIKLKKIKLNENITIVRSEVHGISY